MRSLRLLRVAVLCVLALLFWTKPRPVRGQSECQTFDTDWSYCDNSCANPLQGAEGVIDSSGDGVYSMRIMPLGCRQSNPPSSQCINPEVYVPYEDPNCECSQRDQSCTVDSDCCDDMTCAGGWCEYVQ